MKKVRFILSLLLVAAMSVSFTACGGSDDGADNGGGVNPINNGSNGTYSQTDLVGAWIGYTSDKSLAIVMGVSQNGTGEFYLFKAGTSDYEQILHEEWSYQFNTGNGEFSVVYNSDNTTETFLVTNQTTNSFTFYVNDTPFYMERYTDDNGGGNSSQTGYAPEYVSDCTFRIIHIGQAYYVYFTSNSTIRAEYSRVPLYQTKVTGASYTKTGANTARVTIDYYSEILDQNYTATFDLTFTSETGGKSQSEHLEGTFTIEQEQRADNISAPADISNMTFSINPGSATNQWWKFGDKFGSEISIVSYGGLGSSITYYSRYAYYFRRSDTEATLTISEKIDKNSSESNTVYTLEFQTSNSGRYSSSHYSSFTGKTSTHSGTFTLE